jgi:serine/threonine-protein kinase
VAEVRVNTGEQPASADSEPAALVIRQLAVLPFRTQNLPADVGYLGVGLADAIVTSLVKVRHLVVRETSSIRRYTGKHPHGGAAGRELGVDLVVEGTIQGTRDALRISTRLVHVADETVLWADQYTASEPGIQMVALRVAASVRACLDGSPPAILPKPVTESAEAFRIYLQGRECQTSLDPVSLHKSLELLEKATLLDPGFALAHAALAESYYLMRWLDMLPGKTGVSNLEEAARRAMELDPELAPAYVWLAMIELTHRYRFEEARVLLDRANSLAPNTLCVQRFYCQYLIVTAQFDEALRIARLAQALDPTSPEIKTVVAQIHMFRRDYPRAIELFESLAPVGGRFTRAMFLLGWCHIVNEDYEATLRMFGPESEETPAWVHAMQCYAHGRMGNRAEADRHLAEIRRQSLGPEPHPFLLAAIYVGQRDQDKAMACLEAGYRRGETFIAYLATTPLWDPLHGDPRFQAIVKRVAGPRS